MENEYDQAGGRLDFNPSPDTQVFARYSYSGGNNINPVSVRGTDVPGFPTRDDFSTHLASVSNTHIFTPSLTNTLRGTFLRHAFFFDQRLNRTPPSALGFGYESSNEIGQGPPFFNVSGYSPIGGAITGPRNTTQRHVRDPGQPGVDESHAPGEDRRRDPAHRDRHGPGDRAERVLRVREHVPDEQRGREPAARRAGDVLSGARRLHTRRRRVEHQRVRAGRVATHAARDGELRAALRADQPVHRDRGSLERLHPQRAVTGEAGRAAGARVPRRSRHRPRHRGRRPRVHAARRRRVGSHGIGRVVGARGLRDLLRPVPERIGHVVAGGDQRDALGAVRPVQRRRCQFPEPVPRPAGAGA